MEEIVSSFWDFGITVAVGAVTLLSMQIIAFVRLKIKGVKNDSVFTLLDSAVSTAEYIVNLVVARLQQEVVSNLKAAAADGKLTKNEIEQITKSAFIDIKTMLSEDTIDVLESNFGNIELYIKSIIEKKVLDLKAESK